MFIKIKNSIQSNFQSQTEGLELFNAIKPLYNLLSILGLFPYSVKYDGYHKRFNVIQKSLYINSLCAVSIVLINISFFILHIQTILSLGKYLSYSDVVLTQFNYILELLILVLVSVVSYGAACINKKRYITILNNLIKTSGKISEFGGISHFSTIHMKVRLQVMLGLLIITIIHVAVDCTRNDSWWKVILVLITFVLPQMIQFCVIAHIYVLLLLVKYILRSINVNLESYNPAISRPTGTIKNVLRTLPLMEMKIVYSQAFDITKDINIAFVAPILVTIISCFHAIISEGYIVYHGIVSNAMTAHDIINCSLWLFWQCFKIYILGYIGNDLKIEAAEIGQNIHKIPIEKEGIRTLIEIQSFSSQVFHQMTELTVYGYFPLDSTLLYNTVGAAAMYFIILVQFDKK